MARVKFKYTNRHCPVCRQHYTRRSDNIHRKSRDHIVPKEWGGGDFVAGDVLNLEEKCQQCNERRARAGHCVAALACAQDVAKHSGVKVDTVLTIWFGRYGRLVFTLETSNVVQRRRGITVYRN